MLGSMRWTQAVRKRLFRLLNASRFGRYGKNSWIIAPGAILNPANIEIGDDVLIANNAILAAVPLAPEQGCVLSIGDGSQVGHFNRLYATRSVVLGRRVLTADGVYISDNLHGYEDVERAILDQPVRQIADTTIGDGTWLGHNACVFGARIGRNCVVGANSVVTRDLPDFSVAVGSPARIIRRYDPASKRWRATSPDGDFLPDAPGANGA